MIQTDKGPLEKNVEQLGIFAINLEILINEVKK